MNTIELLQREIQKNKFTIETLHLQLANIIDVIRKNEWISTIENLQSENEDYTKSIEILTEER